MPTSFRQPNPFESLAAIAKFAVIPECTPQFHARYRPQIDQANGFIAFLGSQHIDLATIFSITGAGVDSMADTLQAFFMQVPLPDLNINWVDAQMTEVMKDLIMVVQDPALPPYMQEYRWPIEGAFSTASEADPAEVPSYVAAKMKPRGKPDEEKLWGEPDALEKRVRFGCGSVFGAIVFAIVALKLLDDVTGTFWAIVAGGTLLSGYLAMRWGDEFWAAVLEGFRSG